MAALAGTRLPPVEKQVLADTVPVMSGDAAKADRYEYKSDCSLSY